MAGNMLGCFGVEGEFAPHRFRYTVFGGSGALFEGAEIVFFGEEKITLKVSGGTLEVEGKNFSVGRYAEREVLVVGKVGSVTFVGGREKV